MITRAAIYFDGTLPSSKREERLFRSYKKSLEKQNYFWTNVSGIHRRSEGSATSWEANRHDRSLPEPPFFVPSILETLRAHKTYGRLTHLVPGEADPYCANEVAKNGGLLFTQDSDLLLYDLGPTGGVVLLEDLRVDYEQDAGGDTDATKVIEALVYRQRALCLKLLLEPGQQGMLQFGFELKKNLPSTLARPLLPHRAWACHQDENADAYATFALEYQTTPELLSQAPGDMTFLDPRIAEFVLDRAKTPVNEGLTVWLPALIDRHDQESAWNMSTTIRNVAYSLCRGVHGQSSTVMEFKRSLSPKSKGHPVKLLARQELLQDIEDLINFIDRFVAGTSTANHKLQWITACIGLEISYAAQEGKDSNALKVWQKAAKSEGKVDPGSWDAVHLAALIQGTLYSFRILSQVLRRGTGSYVPKRQVARLEASLSSLPSIAEYPGAVDMDVLFERLHQGGYLDTLSEVTGVADIPFGKTEQKKRKRQEKKVKKQEKKQPGPKSASSNPFDALDMASAM